MKINEFRAWDKENKRMIYIDPFSSQLTCMTWDGHVYDNGKLLDYEMLQYINKKDKNDNKVYEKDVIKRYTKSKCRHKCCEDKKEYLTTGVVEYDEKMLCYYCRDNDLNFPFGDLKNEEIEIIGNIFENKNLAEEFGYED